MADTGVRMLPAAPGAVELEELSGLSISNRCAGVVVLDEQGRLEDYRALGRQIQ